MPQHHDNTPMSLELVTIPCRSDNYAFLLVSPDGATAALVDAPEADPIEKVLTARGLVLTDILLTHHHADHVDGVEALATPDTRIIGAAKDAHRLPALDLPVAEGDTFNLLGATVSVMEVPGHTVGHIAFHVPAAGAVFTGDSLMALGCGRLFEGTAAQMWQSLSKLAALPGDTLVCSGHEYTAANARFALAIEPNNTALQTRAAATFAASETGTPTVPSRLSDEAATNPFLRASLPEVKAAINMQGETDADVFAAIRRHKDQF